MPATAPPASIMIPGSPDVDQEIRTIKHPDYLATPEGSQSDVGSAFNAPPTVELAGKIATPEKKTGVANNPDDCAVVVLPDSIVELEHTEDEADKASNRGSNGKQGEPISALEVGAVGLAGDHVALEANRIDGVNNKLSAVKPMHSPVEAEHDVNEANEGGGPASSIQLEDSSFKAEINGSQDKTLTNNSPTDKLNPTGACKEDIADGQDGRLAVGACSGNEKVEDNKLSSISRIVGYLSAIGTSIPGARSTAAEDKQDISTDDHVLPTTPQQISPNVTESPVILETIDNEAHNVEVDASAATCEGYLSTVSGIGEISTSDKSNESSSVQPMHRLVTLGPIRKWSDDVDNEFPAGQSANNFVIPEIIEHKNTPNDTDGKPFVVISTDVSPISEASESMPVGSSDGYSTDRTYLDTMDDDEDCGFLAGSLDTLTPSSTISSQVGEFQEAEDELEEGEIREGAITVFHDAIRFNVKHPLTNKWTLWYTKPPGGKPSQTWSDLLKEIQTFNSVEEFWAVYNNVPPPSTLANKSDYQLFKFGIRPEWEDPANKRGGRFSFVSRERRCIDTQWLDLLLATIGEMLEPEGVSEVQGIVINIRRAFIRISCWTRTTGTGRGDMDRLMELGRHFKATLGLKKGESLDFSEHDVTANLGNARSRVSFSI